MQKDNNKEQNSSFGALKISNMSWLFGSKKKTVVTSPTADNSSNKLEVNEEDDFLVVQKQPDSSHNSSTNDLPPMYPNLSNGVNGIHLAPAMANNSSPPYSPLQGVPFQLSKTLGLSAGKGPELAALQTQAFINNTDVRAYDYDFGVERSVSREF